MKHFSAKLDGEDEARLEKVQTATGLKSADVLRQLLRLYADALIERLTGDE